MPNYIVVEMTVNVPLIGPKTIEENIPWAEFEGLLFDVKEARFSRIIEGEKHCSGIIIESASMEKLGDAIDIRAKRKQRNNKSWLLPFTLGPGKRLLRRLDPAQLKHIGSFISPLRHVEVDVYTHGNRYLVTTGMHKAHVLRSYVWVHDYNKFKLWLLRQLLPREYMTLQAAAIKEKVATSPGQFWDLFAVLVGKKDGTYSKGRGKPTLINLAR